MEETTTAVVADSAPAAETAPSAAVEQLEVTQSDTTGADASPQTTDAEAPDPDNDPETEPSEGDTPEEAKSKAQLRRERREQREQARIDKAVEETLAAREREREAKAQADKAEADAKAAQQRWQQEFGAFIGTPDVRQALAKEIDDLITQTIAVNPEEADWEALQRMNQARTTLAEKKAALATLDRNAEIYQKLDQFQFEQTQHLYAARAEGLPEAHRAAFLASSTVEQALERLEAGIVARETAKADARVAAAEADWKGRYEKEVAAHAATRTGAPGAGPSPNGANGTGGGPDGLTLERYSRMTSDERRELMKTPEGRARIDRMTRGAA